MAPTAKKPDAMRSLQAEELDDFDSFFLPTTDSCLSRHLTKEMWSQYKDQACKYGVSFKAGFDNKQLKSYDRTPILMKWWEKFEADVLNYDKAHGAVTFFLFVP